MDMKLWAGAGSLQTLKRRPRKVPKHTSYHSATFRNVERLIWKSGVVVLQVQPQVIVVNLGAQGRGFEPRSGLGTFFAFVQSSQR